MHYYLYGIWIGADRVSMEITSVTTKKETVSKLGLFISGGFNVMLGSNFGIVAEGKYVMAKGTIDHPLNETLDISSTDLNIDIGGFLLNIGVKIFF